MPMAVAISWRGDCATASASGRAVISDSRSPAMRSQKIPPAASAITASATAIVHKARFRERSREGAFIFEP